MRVLNVVWYHIGSSVGARHPIHVSCAWVIVCSHPFSIFFPFRVFLLSLLPSRQDPTGTPPIEESGPLANNTPLTVQNRHSRILILLRDLVRSRVKKCIEDQKSQRQKPKWENGSTAVQGLPQRNLHHSILWKMASARVLVVDRYTHTSFFSCSLPKSFHAHHTAWFMTSHLTCLYARVIPSTCHPWCVLERLLSVSSCLSFSCFSLLFTSSLPYPSCSVTWTSSSMSMSPRELPHCVFAQWGVLLLGDRPSSHGYEPNVFDDFHYSETSAMTIQDESGDKDTEPSYLCDVELNDETTGKALSSPLFIQEREEPADRRQSYHSREASLLPAQSFFAHTRKRRDPFRILLERQEQILAELRTEIQEHEFQADSDWRSIQELNGSIESQRREIDQTLAGDEQLRRDQQLLHEQLLEQNRDLREAHMKTLYEMEELKRVQELRFDEFSRRRMLEDQGTIDELTGRIQELQNEVNCMNDSRDFKDAESVRSWQFHVPSQPALLPPFPDPSGMLSRSIQNDEPQRRAAKHLGHTWYIGKRFCKSSCVLFSTLSANVQSVDF